MTTSIFLQLHFIMTAGVVANIKLMKGLLIFSFVLAFFGGHCQEIEHSKWTKILQEYVSADGTVNYKALSKNRASLEAYLEELGLHSPTKNSSKEEAKAYWINAYNAYTIQLILNNYPLKTIKDIEKPWKQAFIKIGASSISLYTIEHEILRPMGDPRIHFAIVCASKSCPKLLNRAYESKTLEQQLNEAAISFINDPSKNRLAPSTLKISKIFKWFKSDFPKKEALIRYLSTFAYDKISGDASIEYLNYNWELND